MNKKNKNKRLKVRNTNPDFSMHVRKMPTLVEKKRKQERKHKKRLMASGW